jgi:glucosamine--fructose-6-phosphate aminotransferase (isomerizing)
MNPTPFECDINDQPDALRTFTSASFPALAELAVQRYDRIVLTGMGSSHYAALPTWRRLVAEGLPAWWIDTGQLLDSPHLLTPSTLLIATSQSGASGEITALCDIPAVLRTFIAVTNDDTSPLAAAANVVVPLHSGLEATVSTKSYLNTLAAHDRLASALTRQPAADVLTVAKSLEHFNAEQTLAPFAADFVRADNPRLAYVGFGEHAATALYAGLITKEGAKLPAEGYIGGQFRHGPLELAGPGLTAVLYGGEKPAAADSLQRLSADLVASGSTVIAATTLATPAAALHLPPPAGGALARLAHGAALAQHLTVALARARGITPGAFTHGNKITTAL